MQLLKTATPTSLEDDIIETTGRLRGLLDVGNKQYAELNTQMAEQVDWQDRITSLTAQRDDIHRQMKGADEQEIRELTRQTGRIH